VTRPVILNFMEILLAIFAPIALLAVLAVFWFMNQKAGGTKASSLFTPSLSVLSKYSRDLTAMARNKKLDPVIGRESEIARVVQVLSRRTKNNPVLIGKAGVGKTAVAEGLALAIIARNVPQVLYGKKVLSLDLSGILAGTKYRGEFEQRLKKITEEIASAKRTVILFIDEIHTLAEAGEAEGAINAADILKPLLARGELQVVGATTKDEYEQYIKKDKTLDRRLQPVVVSEPGTKLTREILQGVKSVYEDYHHVVVEDAALDQAVKSTKNIKSRAYPDKAIDVLDEACSKVSIENVGKLKLKKLTSKPKVTAKDIKEIITQWNDTKL